MVGWTQQTLCAAPSLAMKLGETWPAQTPLGARLLPPPGSAEKSGTSRQTAQHVILPFPLSLVLPWPQGILFQLEGRRLHLKLQPQTFSNFSPLSLLYFSTRQNLTLLSVCPTFTKPARARNVSLFCWLFFMCDPWKRSWFTEGADGER